jgi:hypothetical protein
MVTVATVAALAPTSVAGADEGAQPVTKTVAIGDQFTVSGSDCLYDGRPGDLLLGLASYDEPDLVASISGYVPARANGDWTISLAFPSTYAYHPHGIDHIAEGDYRVVVFCDNPTMHGYFHEVHGDVDYVHVTVPAAGSTTNTVPANTPATTSPPAAKPGAAVPVPVKPHFTG